VSLDRFNYLPKCVELLPIRNGEFASPVLINAIVHDLVIMQETQSIGHVSAIVFSLSNSVRRREKYTVYVKQKIRQLLQ